MQNFVELKKIVPLYIPESLQLQGETEELHHQFSSGCRGCGFV